MLRANRGASIRRRRSRSSTCCADRLTLGDLLGEGDLLDDGVVALLDGALERGIRVTAGGQLHATVLNSRLLADIEAPLNKLDQTKLDGDIGVGALLLVSVCARVGCHPR